MKFVCANANLIQGVNLDTDYDYITIKATSCALAVETLANSFAKSKSDCVLFVWNTNDPNDLVRATEQASLENINFKKIIDELLVDYRIFGDYDFVSIELENHMIISVVKYVTMNNLKESKKSARKSMKESINGDCYIYYDDDEDDNKRLVFCDYVKGVTDTRNWFYLNEYIIDAIHIFKNEKQAQKFIDEHLKYFADQDKVVIAEYPQTVSGFFESKESVRKSIKEERYNVELSDYSGSIVDEDTFDKKSDAIQWANDNGRNCYARIWDNEEGKTVKEWKVKSIKESADDNWYKLKMLNEMLDAMEEDEYNIPKLGIYGVTKNINLDKGAIEALIKYYK